MAMAEKDRAFVERRKAGIVIAEVAVTAATQQRLLKEGLLPLCYATAPLAERKRMLAEAIQQLVVEVDGA
jgi:hypothetical protein